MREWSWGYIDKDKGFHAYVKVSGKVGTACGLGGHEVAVAYLHEECSECRAMLTCTEDWMIENELLLQEGLYYNVNGYSVAVVAVVNPGIDWRAYIGGYDGDVTEERTVRWVAAYGCKLPVEIAALLFPQLPRRLYRP